MRWPSCAGMFGDELFLRTPTGMKPTPFAEQLAEPVGYALGMIHSGLNQRSTFDPATARARSRSA